MRRTQAELEIRQLLGGDCSLRQNPNGSFEVWQWKYPSDPPSLKPVGVPRRRADRFGERLHSGRSSTLGATHEVALIVGAPSWMELVRAARRRARVG